jgi:SsrA-binding protein
MVSDVRLLVANNKKARFDYEIIDTLEVGIALEGCEVKSVRAGKVSLKESYAKPVGSELWLVNCHIAEYTMATFDKVDPLRERKLLLHRRELGRWMGKCQIKGFTIVPLRMYITTAQRVKVEIGLAKSKKTHDKRATVKERDANREISRGMGGRY